MIALPLLALMTVCQGATGGFVSLADKEHWTQLPFTVVDFPLPVGRRGGTRDCPILISIATSEQLQGLWAEIYHSDIPSSSPPPPPEVAFNGGTLIVVSLGVRRSTGYEMDVEGVWKSPDGIIIEVLYTIPGMGCGIGFEESHPAVGILVESTEESRAWLLDKRVHVDVRNRFRRCGDR